MHPQTTFSNTQRAAFEALRDRLTRRVQRSITVEYGADDHEGLWAAFGVDSLPPGSIGRPGMLASILTGSGISGEADVMGADFNPLAEGVSMLEAMKTAGFAAIREYRRMTKGALKIT